MILGIRTGVWLRFFFPPSLVVFFFFSFSDPDLLTPKGSSLMGGRKAAFAFKLKGMKGAKEGKCCINYLNLTTKTVLSVSSRG